MCAPAVDQSTFYVGDNRVTEGWTFMHVALHFNLSVLSCSIHFFVHIHWLYRQSSTYNDLMLTKMWMNEVILDFSRLISCMIKFSVEKSMIIFLFKYFTLDRNPQDINDSLQNRNVECHFFISWHMKEVTENTLNQPLTTPKKTL